MNKNRFLQVVRWELLLSKRQIVTMALVFFGMVVIPQLLALILKPGYSSTAYIMGIICAITLSCYLVFGSANIFGSLKSRQQRINNFMLPASSLEKFIARYLILIIAMPLAAVAGFLSGDIVQWLVSRMVSSNAAEWATGSFISQVGGENGFLQFTSSINGTVAGTAALVVGALSQHALFLFFGSIFHKHPVVMAFLAWIGLGIALTVVGALAAYALSNFLSGEYTVIIYDYWWQVLYYVVNIALIIFCYWFAYRRYTRLQVINNQWINK